MLPLSRKTVLVTRPENQNQEFVNLLEAEGIQPVVLPTVALELCNKLPEKDILQAKNFDFTILTSPSAVDFFHEAYGDFSSKFAVIGEKTATKCTQYHYPVYFVSKENNARSFSKDFKEQNKNLLFPHSSLTNLNDYLPVLEKNHVFEFDLYINKKLNYPKQELLQAVKTDAYTFFSKSSADAFFELLKKHQIELNSSKKIVCIGQSTIKGIPKKYSEQIYCSEYPSTKHIVDLIVRLFNA